MPIFNTFAKRKRAAENADKPVIYTRDHLPKAFRTQVVWIFRVLIGFPQGGLEGQFSTGLLYSFGNKPATRLQRSLEHSP